MNKKQKETHQKIIEIINKEANKLEKIYRKENEIHEDYYIWGLRKFEKIITKKIGNITQLKKEKTPEDSWNELKRAIKCIFKKDDDYSKKITMKFVKHNSEYDEISIFTEDIDNNYMQGIPGAGEARWEIFLNKDGTWEIS